MKYIRYVMLLIVTVLIQNSFARVVAPKFEQDFKDLIAKSKLAVVHFVNYDLLPEGEKQRAETDALHEQLDDLKEDFSDVSRDDDLTGVLFVGVDLRAVPDLVDDYDIKDLSTIILFKDGKPFKRRGVVVKRTGMMTQDELEDWIEDYFEDFKPAVATQQATQVVRYAQPVYTTSYYSRPYRRYYRPAWRGYYGYPYGYGRRGFGWGSGFGFGIGGRRGGIGFGFGW